MFASNAASCESSGAEHGIEDINAGQLTWKQAYKVTEMPDLATGTFGRACLEKG